MNTQDQVAQIKDFYAGKKVIVTGGFGFKGSWLTLLLQELGAEVFAYGLINDDNKLYKLASTVDSEHALEFSVDSQVTIGIFRHVAPDLVFHLAAQPIVSEGYRDPRTTFQTNIMGPVNVLEAVRALEKKVSVVNVTTDKVYFNDERPEGYVEDDLIKGQDPYSASKSCSELITYSFNESFFKQTHGSEREKVVSTCRAGNVIGGGDFSTNRIIPDIARSIEKNETLHVRSPKSVRPYEHVLDAVYAYALLGAMQYADNTFAGYYNVGPNDESLLHTEDLVDFFQEFFKSLKVEMSRGAVTEFKETNVLKLNSSLFRETFDWNPRWNSKEDILGKTAEWYAAWLNSLNDRSFDLAMFTREQVKDFLNV